MNTAIEPTHVQESMTANGASRIGHVPKDGAHLVHFDIIRASKLVYEVSWLVLLPHFVVAVVKIFVFIVLIILSFPKVAEKRRCVREEGRDVTIERL